MWTIESFKSVYRRYESSGLCIKDFCLNECITRSRFYYWLKQYRKLFKPGVSITSPVVDKVVRKYPAGSPGFIPVLLSSDADATSFPLKGMRKMPPDTPCSSSDSSFMEISYPNGVCVRLGGEKDMELIKTLILLSR